MMHINFFPIARTVALSLLVVCFISCKQSQKTYYDTGELKELITVNDQGQKHGQYKRLDIDGSLLEEGVYENDLQVGIKKLYDDNGVLESTSTYKNGTMDGAYQVFYPSGKLKIDATYKDNALNGIFKKFNENGALKERVTFMDGEENGPFEEYHDNGEVEWKGTYRNGDHEFGLLERFDARGQLLKKMMFDSTFIGRTIWKKEGYIEQ